MIRIGSARIDENGKICGGKAGDQTGKEVSIQEWYANSKGWVVLRANDTMSRLTIAVAMEAACANNHIGYDQTQRNSLYNLAQTVGFNPALVKSDCETDCSALVRVCLAYAGIHVQDFNTASERSILERTGLFTILTDPKYTKSSDYLLRGDILVTATKGHTVVLLDDGAKIGGAKTKPKTGNPYDEPIATIKLGTKGNGVRWLQYALNQRGYKLVVDGIAGNMTIGALMDFQKKHGLVVDGICGPYTRAKLRA